MFRVALELFHGPLDLLLHLVRKQEVDASDVPIASVVEQYVRHVEVIEVLDVDAAGDFLDLASTLIEIKSKSVLPADPEEEPIEEDQPQADLVKRLMEYQRIRHAATELERRGEAWGQRFARQASDLPEKPVDPAEQPIHGVELWDLVSALGRVMRDKLVAPKPYTVKCDDTPVEVFMRRVHTRLVESGSAPFHDLFPSPVHKSTLVGIFLAVLELIRRGCAVADQQERFGEVVLAVGPEPLPEQVGLVEDEPPVGLRIAG